MQLNDIQLWILQAIALLDDRGITETTLESIARSMEPDVVPHLEKRLNQFEQMKLIDQRNEIIIKMRGATKLRHFTINDRGRSAIAAALRDRENRAL